MLKIIHLINQVKLLCIGNHSFSTKHFVPELIREYWNVMGQNKPKIL